MAQKLRFQKEKLGIGEGIVPVKGAFFQIRVMGGRRKTGAVAGGQVARDLGFEVDDHAGAARRGRFAGLESTGILEALLGVLVPLPQHSLHVLGHHRLLVAATHLRHQRVQRQRAVTGKQQHR